MYINPYTLSSKRCRVVLNFHNKQRAKKFMLYNITCLKLVVKVMRMQNWSYGIPSLTKFVILQLSIIQTNKQTYTLKEVQHVACILQYVCKKKNKKCLVIGIIVTQLALNPAIWLEVSIQLRNLLLGALGQGFLSASTQDNKGILEASVVQS